MKLRSTLLAVFGALLAGALIAQAQVPGVNSTLNSVFTLTYDNSTMKPTYSSSMRIIPAASATDVCNLVGSSSKVIKIRRILIDGAATAVTAAEPIAILRRSALNTATAGTNWALGQVTAYDTSSAVGTASSESWSVNPSNLAPSVLIADPYFTFSNYTTGIGNGSMQLYYGEFGSPLVLRSATTQVAVNLNGNTVAGAIMNCTFEWTEE